ncbi:class I SAM-dependent methyltransferase [Echinicola soli]|uniref:Class I SAM-dependent methyltransferase n=1 Tax=Echinicola soli TaxID=2591634 RepID=A0A514CM09_9BACT|nr:class I SAM-dependent methyltransferase [Echinicola soli]QDH80859.1 class I SAM-dependent methyltransferase [Echinicola soli]
MEEKDKYISFYDQFSTDSRKKEISALNVCILEKLMAEGLKSNHKIVEGGCGLGELSHLLANKVKNGKVLGVDINEDTVQRASELWKKQKNLAFVKAEMKAFENRGETYDFFILTDILQQVSTDKHLRLFEAVRKHSHQDTTVFINLPTPPFSEWNAHNDPESLQFVESTVNIAGLIESLTVNDYYLDKAVSYSVFYEENDFQYFIFKPLTRIAAPTPKKKWANLKEKLPTNLLGLL